MVVIWLLVGLQLRVDQVFVFVVTNGVTPLGLNGGHRAVVPLVLAGGGELVLVPAAVVVVILKVLEVLAVDVAVLLGDFRHRLPVYIGSI